MACLSQKFAYEFLGQDTSLTFALRAFEGVLAVEALQFFDVHPGEFGADALHQIADFRLAVGAGMGERDGVLQHEAAGEMVDQEGLAAGGRVDLHAAIGDAAEAERGVLGDGFQGFAEFFRAQIGFQEDVDADEFAGVGFGMRGEFGPGGEFDLLVVARGQVGGAAEIVDELAGEGIGADAVAARGKGRR